MPDTTQTVELVDNELRAFLADVARLGRKASSLRIAVSPDGMQMQVDGGRWTPAFGHPETTPKTTPVFEPLPASGDQYLGMDMDLPGDEYSEYEPATAATPSQQPTDEQLRSFVDQLTSDRDEALKRAQDDDVSEVSQARAQGEATALRLTLSHLHTCTRGQHGAPLAEQPDWRRVLLGTFGELVGRADDTTARPTIDEHVRAGVDLQVLADIRVDVSHAIEVFRRQLADVMIQLSIVLDGEDVYCAEPYGLAPWHGSIDDARQDARFAAGHTSTHFFGALRDEFTRRGPEGVHELFEKLSLVDTRVQP